MTIRERLIKGNTYYQLYEGNKFIKHIVNTGIPLKPANELSFQDRNAAMVWIIQNQFGRRNLNSYQRSVLALRLEEILRPIAEANLHLSQGQGIKGQQISADVKPIERETRTKVAKAARVSHDTISKVKTIEAKATPEQKAKLVSGEKTINQVFVAIRRDEVREQVKKTDWPTGKYRVIYADPPWAFMNTGLEMR